MPPIVDSVSNALETNAGMNGYEATSLTKSEALGLLSSTSLFSCITHGTQTSINTSDNKITVSDINLLSNTAFDNLKFVYLGACDTGIGRNGANNLANAIFNKGADAVLGFTTKIVVNETNAWTEAFMIELSRGSTINEAMDAADEIVHRNPDILEPYTTSDTDNRYFQGSLQMVPCN